MFLTKVRHADLQRTFIFGCIMEPHCLMEHNSQRSANRNCRSPAGSLSDQSHNRRGIMTSWQLQYDAMFVNSFGAKFQTTFVVCFFFYFKKLSFGKTFICKVKMSNSVDPDEMAHWAVSSGSMLLQKPIIIACGSERVNCILWDSSWKFETLIRLGQSRADLVIRRSLNANWTNLVDFPPFL